MDREKQIRGILKRLQECSRVGKHNPVGELEFDIEEENKIVDEYYKELKALELQELDKVDVERVIKSKMLYERVVIKGRTGHWWIPATCMGFLVKAICDTFGRPRYVIDKEKVELAIIDFMRKQFDERFQIKKYSMWDKLSQAISAKSEQLIKEVEG
jgi:hypothetical protein